MGDSVEEKKNELPSWAKDWFFKFVDHQIDIDNLLHLSIEGISVLRINPKIVEFFGESKYGIKYKEKLQYAEQQRDLAQREVDNDFPRLHEQATLALWSCLEALVRSLAAGWLTNTQNAWQVDGVKRLKVRLGDYEALEPCDRSLWVVDLVDQEASGPLRNGVSRFECLLEIFGLDGKVEEEVRKTLFELSQVRHVILHRHGEADKKLLDSCPWLPLHAGERVKITHEMYHRYHLACDIYRTALFQRVRGAYGLAPLKELDYTKELEMLRGDTSQPTPPCILPRVTSTAQR